MGKRHNILKHVATSAHLKQCTARCTGCVGPSVNKNVCPDPVWKPVTSPLKYITIC